MGYDNTIEGGLTRLDQLTWIDPIVK